MTTITDADIKEIKDRIADLGKKVEKIDADLREAKTEILANLNTTNVRIESLEKRMTENFSNQEKRIANQEFIYRAVFISIIGLITSFLGTTGITVAIQYLLKHPIF